MRIFPKLQSGYLTAGKLAHGEFLACRGAISVQDINSILVGNKGDELAVIAQIITLDVPGNVRCDRSVGAGYQVVP